LASQRDFIRATDNSVGTFGPPCREH